MIPKYLLLVKMNVINSFRINQVLHTQDKKQKSRAIWFGILYFILLVVFIGYSVSLSFSFVFLGIEELLPSVMLVLSSIVILFLTFMKSNGSIFCMKDHDMVMSMPVSHATVILSRLTSIYIFNLLVCAIILGPAFILFSVATNASISVWIMGVCALVFAPLIPMVFSLTVSVLILAISSRFKHKNIFVLILNIAVILAVMALSFHAENVEMEQLADIGVLIDQTLTGMYPLARLFSNAFTQNDWCSYGLFILISVGVTILYVALLSKYYTAINEKLLAHSSKSKYKMGELQVDTPFKALYKKELRLFLSCPIYALNSAIGAILLIMAAVAFLFVDPHTILVELELNENLLDTLKGCIPFALTVLIGMNATTSSALSLEGKSRWIMCSAPVKPEVIFNAKIAVNLTIMLPTSFIAVVILSFSLPINFFEALCFVVILFLFSMYISVFDMLINAKFPRYDWTNEQQVVKQGISVLLSMLAGFLSSIILLGLSILFINYTLIAYVIAIILMMSATYFLYQRLRRIKLYV